MKILKSIFGIFLIFVTVVVLSFFNIYHQKIMPDTDNVIISAIIYILIFGAFIGILKSIWSNLIVWKGKDNKEDTNEPKKHIQEYKNEYQTIETIQTSVQSTTVKENIDEDSLYEQAINELENNTKVKSLWAKAFAKSEGNEEKAKALYIQYRVDNLNKIHEKEKQQQQRQKEILRKEWLQEVEDKLKVFLKNNNLELINRISDTKVKANDGTVYNTYIEYVDNEWNIVNKILYP